MEENSLHYKKSNHKIYVLITVISLLVAVNAYLFIKKRQENYFSPSEKKELVLQINQIEAELGKTNGLFLINHELKKAKELALEKMIVIKGTLHNKELKNTDLVSVKNQIADLRAFVKSFDEQATAINKENTYLKNERDKLQAALQAAKEKSNSLTQKNRALHKKLKEGAALKATNILITALRTKSNGKTKDTKYAGSANKLQISFSIVPNPLAAKEPHKVYLRVFDPYGNLIANGNNLFYVNEQQMQYSGVSTCTYNEENLNFSVYWANPKSFIKGNYTVILYADNFVMGKANINLR